MRSERRIFGPRRIYWNTMRSLETPVYLSQPSAIDASRAWLVLSALAVVCEVEMCHPGYCGDSVCGFKSHFGNQALA